MLSAFTFLFGAMTFACILLKFVQHVAKNRDMFHVGIKNNGRFHSTVHNFPVIICEEINRILYEKEIVIRQK